MNDLLNLSANLSVLMLAVIEIIETKLAGGLIHPSQSTMFRWKIDKFHYAEDGPIYSGAKGEYFNTLDWSDAINMIVDQVENTDLFKCILSASGIDTQSLSMLTRKIAELRLYGKTIEVENLITTFIKDIRNEPVTAGAVVDLNGIVVESEDIHIRLPESNINIRQVKSDDLEFPENLFHRSPFVKQIHSIIEFTCLSNNTMAIQDLVEKYIAILRLYSVGSVDFTEYKMLSDSILGGRTGRLSKGNKSYRDKKYFIKKTDEVRLKRYFEILDKSLPESLFRHNTDNDGYIFISYTRYREALLETGIFERHIANAVMGLEGLYLKGSEKSELSYRLRMRMSKLFSFVDRGALVADTMKDAYEIRSKYVHGSQLNDKEKSKYCVRYDNDINNLLLKVLEFLRVSIVCFILTKEEKDALINIIDESFYSTEQNAKLESLLTHSIELIQQ